MCLSIYQYCDVSTATGTLGWKGELLPISFVFTHQSICSNRAKHAKLSKHMNRRLVREQWNEINRDRNTVWTQKTCQSFQKTVFFFFSSDPHSINCKSSAFPELGCAVSTAHESCWPLSQVFSESTLSFRAPLPQLKSNPLSGLRLSGMFPVSPPAGLIQGLLEPTRRSSYPSVCCITKRAHLVPLISCNVIAIDKVCETSFLGDIPQVI